MLVVVVSRLVIYGWCDRVGDLKVREMTTAGQVCLLQMLTCQGLTELGLTMTAE